MIRIWAWSSRTPRKGNPPKHSPTFSGPTTRPSPTHTQASAEAVLAAVCCSLVPDRACRLRGTIKPHTAGHMSPSDTPASLLVHPRKHPRLVQTALCKTCDAVPAVTSASILSGAPDDLLDEPDGQDAGREGRRFIARSFYVFKMKRFLMIPTRPLDPRGAVLWAGCSSSRSRRQTVATATGPPAARRNRNGMAT